jgi:hypothetical protein
MSVILDEENFHCECELDIASLGSRYEESVSMPPLEDIEHIA